MPAQPSDLIPALRQLDSEPVNARSHGTRRVGWTLPAVLLAMLAGQGCTMASVCGAVPDFDRASLTTLRCHAGAGSKRAAFALGQRYEAGRGVAPSRERALSLYRQAARDTPSRPYIYRPGDRNKVVATSTGMGEAGLVEAKQAVRRLEGSSVELSAEPQ